MGQEPAHLTAKLDFFFITDPLRRQEIRALQHQQAGADLAAGRAGLHDPRHRPGGHHVHLLHRAYNLARQFARWT